MAWPTASPSCQRPCFFKRFDHLARHVALVMLGENGLGAQLAGRLEHAFGDHALPLAEQVRQQALIGHFQVMRAVGEDEADLLVSRT